MLVYIIVFSVMFFAPYMCNRIKGKEKLVYCVIMGILLSLLFGFRSEELGMMDVKVYYIPMFRTVKTMSFSQIIQAYPFERGNLFQILTKLISMVISDEHIWLFLISLPFTVAITYAIYSYSKFPMMGFFLMFGSYIILVNMFLIRNSLCLAFLIICYICIQRKKWILSLIFYVLAILTHTTAILFGITYLIVKFRSNWKIYLGSIIVSYFIISNSAEILSSLFQIINGGYYSNYDREGSAGLLYFSRYIVFLVIYIILYLVNHKTISINSSKILFHSEKTNSIFDVNNSNFNMMCLSIIFMSLATVVAEFYRIGMFFGFFGLIGLSNEIYDCKNKFLKYSCCAFLIIVCGYFTYKGLYAANLAPYKSWLF